MARGRKVKSGDKRSFGDFKKSQNEKRLNRIYSQGKKDYASQNRGQSGGSSSIPSQGKKDAFVNLQRQKFFGGRDVPEERIFRRTAQDTNLDLFKKRFTKPVNIVDPNTGEVTGTVSGLSQATDDAPRSLTEERQRLADLYGPTGKEVLGDIGYGLGQLGKAYGIPIVSSIMRGVNAVKSGVEAAWDAVRGEPTSAQGTAFPQPGSDTKDLFSSIDTGIAQVDPNNLLVQIAKANEGRFDDAPTFQEQLANATAENLNVPKIGDVIETASDYVDAYRAGVNLDTPIGNININPASQGISLGNYIPTGDMTGISYGGFFKPEDNSYNVGIGTQLPYDIGLSAGVSSNDAPGVALSKYVPLNIPGSGGAIPFVNFSPEGSSLGFNASFDPVRAIYPNASIGLPLNIGASVSDQGKIDPRISFNVPFNSSGLGYMFK